MTIRHVEHFRVHGQYIGGALGGEAEWTLEPYKQPLLEVLKDQSFSSRAVLLTAIDEALGADLIAEMEALDAEKKAREAISREAARQAAAARSFTGEQFDEHRPLKEVARAIHEDLLAAMVQGTIPPDRYRVTVRQQRYDPRLYVYAWAVHEIRETVLHMTHRYNRCIGEPYNSDRWHFRLIVEWPNPWRSRPQAEHGTYEDYEAGHEQAQAEADACGRAYIAKHPLSQHVTGGTP